MFSVHSRHIFVENNSLIKFIAIRNQNLLVIDIMSKTYCFCRQKIFLKISKAWIPDNQKAVVYQYHFHEWYHTPNQYQYKYKYELRKVSYPSNLCIHVVLFLLPILIITILLLEIRVYFTSLWLVVYTHINVFSSRFKSIK